MRWLALCRPGDWGLILLAVLACASSFPLIWQRGAPERAIVRRGGEVFAELDLARDQHIAVPGPLGVTHIEVLKRRVRVAADPGRHQYCVRQGWLERAGEIAVCAPNEVSVQITGREDRYDTLSY